MDEKHEAKCQRCGRCCYYKIKFGDDVKVVTKIPCKHLDLDTKLCKHYENRFEANPDCHEASELAEQHMLPADCPYVEGIEGYKPPIELNDPLAEMLTTLLVQFGRMDKDAAAPKDDVEAARKLIGTPQEKAAAEFAPGLPDPKRFGHPGQLPLNQLLSYVIQQHDADRAGKHYDIRFGPDKGGAPTMMSWAGRKLPEKPGEKTMAFQQPLHTVQYADFEGEIVRGYGKGMVKTHDRGRVIVTKANPDQINFVVAHKKHPETFTLVRRGGPPKSGTARTKQTQGGTWLMINTTPTDVIEHKKLRYAKVPASDVEKLFSEDYLHQEKIDGAAALYKLFSDRIEVLSYRPTSEGRPIVHTYRVGNTTGINIPKHLAGTILRGELYGVRTSTGKAVPPQELGGILNATTQRSLEKQKAQKVELKNMIFNVLRYGKEDVSVDTPLEERLKMLEEIQQHLPKGKFRLPEMARTPEEQKKLWERVSSGKHPLTHEGVVAWPIRGGKPSKVKLYSDHDVYVRDIFPGDKRLEGTGAGGFSYSLTPTGDIVGKVGTGFSEATRKQMWETPEEFKGRVAKIKSQGQFPSGAHRAPAFLSLHEDYPAVKAAQSVSPAQYRDFMKTLRESESMFAPTTITGGLGELGAGGAFSGAITGIGALGRAGLHKLAPRVFDPLRALPTIPGGEYGAKVGLGTALKQRLPGSITAGAKMFYQPNIIMGVIEMLRLASAASQIPEHQRGKWGYLGALGDAVSRAGRAAALKRRQAFGPGFLGGLKGIALTPMHATMNPIATITDLVQTLAGREKGSKEQVLGPIIKQALAKRGVEGETLADLHKAAVDAMPVEGPSIGDKIRAFLIGMKPEELVSARKNLRGASQSYAKLRGLMESLGLSLDSA